MGRSHGYVCLLALWSASALAAEPAVDYGSIDAFYLPVASIDAQWPEARDFHNDGGNGYGVRFLGRVAGPLMVLGEFDRAKHDSGLDTDQFRVGVGYAGPSTSGVYLTFDHLNLGVDNGNGVALHGRVAGAVAGPLSLYLDAAYGGWDAARFYYDGFEFTLGATADLPQPSGFYKDYQVLWGFFADYRLLLLDDGDSVDRLHQSQARVGVRWRFCACQAR